MNFYDLWTAVFTILAVGAGLILVFLTVLALLIRDERGKSQGDIKMLRSYIDYRFGLLSESVEKHDEQLNVIEARRR